MIAGVTASLEAELRSRCAGDVALPARLEPWQLDLCSDPARLASLVDEHGSPLNVLHLSAMARNAAELNVAARRCGIELGIYFARKANKALALVDEARRLGLGVDLASERELTQALDRGVPPSELVMTAAIKPVGLLERCVSAGVTVVIDNRDELKQILAVAGTRATPARIALRLAARLPSERTPTRFGFDRDEIPALLDGEWAGGETAHRPSIEGVHFHLDGYDPTDRVVAVVEALDLIHALRSHGHRPAFLDIGGGIPISYVESAAAWSSFWAEHRRALLGEREPLTYGCHGLGLIAHRGEIVGAPDVYPFHHTLTRGEWLTRVLTTPIAPGRSVADAIRGARVELRCEPGRALLDGCGLTAARIAYRKRRRDGTWLVGAEMNRTQCRSSSADFLVDPLLVPGERRDATGPIAGYLVGAYCVERELLTWRRLRFSAGVAVGDIVVFPNTAGYLMHILESSSHRMPLARNLIVDDGGVTDIDPVDM